MASSPVKFLFLLLLVCIIGWIIFMFAARLLAWFLSRVMRASVVFRVAGCNCLRDVVVKFKKGAMESISIGEIKLSLRQSLVKLGFGFISKDPKLQLLICDLELVIRSPEKKIQKVRSHKPPAGRGSWMVVSTIARFLSVNVTELVVKMPKVTAEVKDLKLDISKHGGIMPILFVKLNLLPFLVHMNESRFSFDHASNFNQEGCSSAGPTSVAIVEKNFAPFICEDLVLSCEFGHDKEVGIMIKNVEISSGEVIVNLNEGSFQKKNLSETSTDLHVSREFSVGPSRKAQKGQAVFSSLRKYASLLPERVSFNLPKLDVRFVHREQDLLVRNNIMGIHLRSSKSLSSELGETTSHFDILMDFSEIHLLKEGSNSILEILKVAVTSSLDIPMQSLMAMRAEIDVKLGGTQCNIITSRLKPWMHLHLSRRKPMVLRDETSNLEASKVTDIKQLLWTCTMSAPEMTIVLHDLSGSPLYHGCTQSSHLFANNIANGGVAVHGELGELNLHRSDEYHDCPKENLFGIETNSGSLMHIERASIDWGHKEIDSTEEPELNTSKLIFCIDVIGMHANLNFSRIESLITTFLSFQALIKCLPINGESKKQKSVGHSRKPISKGIRMLKFNLERCSVNLFGEVGLENTLIADPKRVNFGSQGGEVLISLISDGTLRKAKITSRLINGCEHLKYSVNLDIFRFSLCVNKEKQSSQMELERARSIYQECCGVVPNEKITLFDMQNAKLLRRPGGPNEVAFCSLFSATDIAIRWEPDVHLSLYEFFLRLKLVIYNQKLQSCDNEINIGADVNQTLSDKHLKKKESIFAIDVEMLSISAGIGDGVETIIQVQSIFSENAKIGVLLEDLSISLNEARVFKSSRMQISRIPKVHSSTGSFDAKKPLGTTWDWVIQGLDVHICMPYRLPLRAIEDAVEDMLRGLKLIIAAKISLIFPGLKENPKKAKTRQPRFGRVRFCIRKLTAEIEEEPIQGWLDEHYQLLKNKVDELNVRLKFFDDVLSDPIQGMSGDGMKEAISEKTIHYNGLEIGVHDRLSIQKLREKVHEETFRSYYDACQNLVSLEGSGACKRGFQSGFKPSASRTSLLSIHATELDVTLTCIDGGDCGMLEFIKKHDSVCAAKDIPFSRILGRKIVLQTGSLVVKLRNFTFPIFSATMGKCEGCIVLAQQATCFQPQIEQDVVIGKWRNVTMMRSASGTTPPLKMYHDLPIRFQNGEVSFGVGFEPALADISYAFTVALRRANLSVRNVSSLNDYQGGISSSNDYQGGIQSTRETQPKKKERSLPWWDDVRYYIHGKIILSFKEMKWNVLATTNPYERLDRLQIISGHMDIEHTDGRVSISANEFKAFASSLESLVKNCSLKPPPKTGSFLEAPSFCLEVSMEWECASRNSLDHYLHALPVEGEPRKKVYDPFRSISLSLRWNFSLRPPISVCEKAFSSSHIPGNTSVECSIFDFPTLSLGAHDLSWIFKFWNLNYLPPHKLRSFSRWPRFGVPRVARSGNLSLDKVMTEFMLRIDAMPCCIKHMPLEDDDPAHGLTFRMSKLKYELCYSRGKQQYTFECKRDPLDLVYQGLDLHALKAFLNKEIIHDCQGMKDTVKSGLIDRTHVENSNYTGVVPEKNQDDGFLLSSEYFTIRKQAPKADPARLLSWQDAGKKHLETTYVRSEFENGSESDHTRSDPSDDDGYNVVIADNCQRVFVYGLKLLWTIANRDAVWSWVGGISKAFQPPKPSPSRQYVQRKLFAEKTLLDDLISVKDDNSILAPLVIDNGSISSPYHDDTLDQLSSPSRSIQISGSPSGSIAKHEDDNDSDDQVTRHFMVNVIQPQFNLHSEDANGRFLLAAASGRVLARSFHSVFAGLEMIKQALGTGGIPIPEDQPEMAWKHTEYSAMLEQVQAHVAPTDVDPGAGLQWLPKILRSSPKLKRTGALLERVFMPCTMYFRYTRHKGASADLKMKPLKELAFNSPNITATMTSRQFQVMLDILSNLLFARLPKPRKNSLSYVAEDDEDAEEEADEVVPEGVEEVELAKINLEKINRERKLLLDDIRTLSTSLDLSGSSCTASEDDLWMITCGRSKLIRILEKELVFKQKSRRIASAMLRTAFQKAAQLQLMEKEKNKSPSYAMRISLRIEKVVWSMLADGKTFAEAELNSLAYHFNRDYKDVGIAQFTSKFFVVRNCLPNAKCDMLLSAWNPPPEWGKNVMLRVDAKQGAPKDGTSPLDLFEVEIYPLKIHLTETMYRMMWEYFFPEEEQDSQRRQEVWKVSTTAGLKRVKKNTPVSDSSILGSHTARESDGSSKSNTPSIDLGASGNSSSSAQSSTSHASKRQGLTASMVCGSTSELRRTSSFDRNEEGNVADMSSIDHNTQAISSSNAPIKSGPLDSVAENYNVNEDSTKSKSKDSKIIKSGRLSHEEKKVGKIQDDKRSRARKMMEFHNIKISQVELIVTYEGSRFAVSDLRLLMDTFHRPDFTGTWRKLFSRVKKHIIWGVLKSVTGMQGKKFKDKVQNQREPNAGVVPDSDLILSDSDGGEQEGRIDQFPMPLLKRGGGDGAGDGFVTSIRGLFNSQRRKATAFMRNMRGEPDNNDIHGEGREGDGDPHHPFARQLTITKAKKFIRRGTKKLRTRTQKSSGTSQRDSLPSSPREEASPSHTDSSSTPPYEDFQEYRQIL